MKVCDSSTQSPRPPALCTNFLVELGPLRLLLLSYKWERHAIRLASKVGVCLHLGKFLDAFFCNYLALL